MTGPTLCQDCDNRTMASKNDPPWRWQCIRHKRLPAYGFVTSEPWQDFPPYLYCRDVNGGLCPLYVPARATVSEDA